MTSPIVGMKPDRATSVAPATVNFVGIGSTSIIAAREGSLRSRRKNTPFVEAKLEGRVLKTFVAGRAVYDYASA